LIVSGPGPFRELTLQEGSQHVTALFEASDASWQRFYLQRAGASLAGSFYLFSCEVIPL
jgi:hypothetical protein